MVSYNVAGQQRYWMEVIADPHAPVALPASTYRIAGRLGRRAVLSVSEEKVNPVALPETRVALMFIVVTPTTAITKLLSDWQPSQFFYDFRHYSGP